MSATDDYPDGGSEGEMLLDTPISGVFEFCPPPNDSVDDEQDSFVFDVDRYSIYEIHATVDTGSIQLEAGFHDVVKHASFRLSGPENPLADSTLIVQARLSRVFFTATNRGTATEDQNYTIVAREYEIPEGPATRLHLNESAFFRKQEIETEFDRDSYIVLLRAGHTYRFDLKGIDSGEYFGTLADPLLRLYDGGNALVKDDNDSGLGKNSSFAYVAPYTGTYYLMAAGLGDKTGSYSISFDRLAYPDDAAANLTTTSRIDLKPNNRVVGLDGALEVTDDKDWHKLDVIAGRHYQVVLKASPELQSAVLRIRGIHDTPFVSSKGAVSGLYFQAEATDTFHVEVHGLNGSDVYGDYTIYASDNVVSPIRNHETANPIPSQSILLSQIFFHDQFPTDFYQVVSEADFFIGEAVFEKYSLHNLTPEQFDQAVIKGSDTAGEYDLSVRAVGGGTTTPWTQTVVNYQIQADKNLDINKHWDATNTQRATDDVVTFRFADSAPSYFAAGRFNNVQRVSANVRAAFEGIFGDTQVNGERGLGRQLDIEFVYDDSESADIQIFTADADDRAIGYWPGKFGFGDIVLDNDFFAGSATATPGSREYFDILKSVAMALGTKPFSHEFTKNETVVGLKYSDPTGKPFPETFGTYDVRTLQRFYLSNRRATVPFANTDFLGDDPTKSFVRTIHEQSDANAISAENSTRPAYIDLRQTMTSYLMEDGPWQSYTISNTFSQFYETKVERARGSEFGDQIFGNHSHNRIEGNGGDDMIRGFGDADDLLGGFGNDTYLYETGDGDDRILETGTTRAQGGIDTLRIMGKFGMDDLATDLSFKKLGDDLVIDLNMNGEDNRSSGQITIRYMSYAPWQIEKLDLRSFTGTVGVFSLPSIWNAATFESKRFAPTGGSDEFGLTAAPV